MTKEHPVSKYLSHLLVGAIALLSAFCAPYAFTIGLEKSGYTNSVAPFFILAAVSAFGFAALRTASKRTLLLSTAGGWLLALLLVVGRQVYLFDHLPFTLRFWLGAAATILSIGTALGFLLAIFCEKLPVLLPSLAESRFESALSRLLAKRFSFFGLWAALALLWAIPWLTFYPGIMAYDSNSQLIQIVVGRYNTHHPLFHTMLLRFFFWLGMLLGSYGRAVMLYTLFQLLTMAAIYAYSICWLGKHGASAVIRLAAFLGFALIPYHGLFSIIATKDSLFTAATLLVFLKLYDLASAPSTFLKSPPQLAALLGSAVFFCLMRNQGLYVLLGLTPFALILLRKHWKRTIPLFLILLLACNGSLSALQSLLGADNGSPAEMLSIPSQQVARVWALERASLTEAQVEGIEHYFDIGWLDKYDPHLADLTKAAVQTVHFKEAPAGFFQLWASIGAGHLNTYTDAWLITTLGYWYPDVDYHNVHTFIETDMKTLPDNGILFERASKLPFLLAPYEAIMIDRAHEGIPLFSMLLSIGMGFWVLLVCALLAIVRRQKAWALPILLLLLLWGTLILSPIVLLRYMLPILTCNIILLSSLLTQKAPE